MGEGIVRLDDFEFAVPLLAIFARLAFGVTGGEGYVAAIGRPIESIHTGLNAGQLNCFTSVRRDHIDLPLSVAVRDKGKSF